MKPFKRIFLLLSIAFIGCNPIPDKSITKPIAPEELFTIFQKDSLFKSTYSMAKIAQKLILNSDVAKAEFMDLTYPRFHEFVQLARNDGENYRVMDSLYSAEWKESLESYKSRIDSLVNSYEEQKLANPNLRLPFLIDEMISLNEKGYDNQVVFSMLIEEYFNPRFEGRNKYVQRKIKEELEKKDKLSSDLFFQLVDIAAKLN